MDEGGVVNSHRYWHVRLLLLPVVGMFLPILMRGDFFLYRDAAHYYHPLFAHVQDQWRSGRLPLWNSSENAGQPLAADVTASAFYPAKMLFFLPMSYERQFVMYVIVHLMIGWWGTYRLARAWRISPGGAAVASISYVLSGHILFQYCNVVYLVSASWLPMCVQQLVAALRHGGWRPIMLCGVGVALMILGGEPQTAVHVLLVGVAGAFVFPQQSRTRLGSVLRFEKGVRLAAIGMIAAGLSAVQWLPSLEWAPWTNRMSGSLHDVTRYRFSVGPWRWPEVVCPNVSGRGFPVHRRWIYVIPAEGQAWSPSLYMGLLPAIFAWRALPGLGGTPRRRFVLLVGILALLASLGWYGFGWILAEISTALGHGPIAHPPTGGLYWFLTTCVPGYSMFRYPAKWWTFVAWALSIAAGWGWDMGLRDLASVRWRLRLSVVCSMVLWLASNFLSQGWGALMADQAASPLWGPFDAAGAWLDLRNSLLHSAIVGGIAWLLWRRSAASTRWLRAGLFVLIAADLCLAQAWMIPSGNAELFHSIPDVVRQMSGEQPTIDHEEVTYPAEWSVKSDPRRLEDLVAYERSLLLPKYHLPYSWRVVRSNGSAIPRDVEMLWRNASQGGNLEILALRRLLGVSHIVSGRGRVDRAPQGSRVTSARPRVWIERDFETLGESVECITFEPGHVVVKVHLHAPGRLVLAEYPAPGWHAVDIHAGRTDAIPIERTNHVMQSVKLLPGDHEVRFNYLPRSVVTGAVISIMSLLATVMVMRRGRRRR